MPSLRQRDKRAAKRGVSRTPRMLRAAKAQGAAPRIDREGGRFGAGLLRGVSVLTRGEALGHDFWVDAEMLDQTAEAINAAPGGIKSRFAHPGLSSDGLGRYVGRLHNARVEGDRVLADQHFAKSAHETPDGDLAGYLLDLAEEDPASYGLSIVFQHDQGESERFSTEHADKSGAFRSPDPRNLDHLPHARVAALHAADAVDEPAANPDGLFHRLGKDQQATVLEADALAAYALGVSDEMPKGPQLGIDPQRARLFCTRFLATRGLSVTPTKEDAMGAAVADEPITDETVVEETTTEETTADTETPIVDEPAETAPTAELGDRAAEGKRFLAAFGQQGAVWFAEGKTFDEARDLHVAHLQAENQTLRDRLAKFAAAETTPVDFQAENRPGDKPRGAGLEARIRVVGAAAAR